MAVMKHFDLKVPILPNNKQNPFYEARVME